MGMFTRLWHFNRLSDCCFRSVSTRREPDLSFLMLFTVPAMPVMPLSMAKGESFDSEFSLSVDSIIINLGNLFVFVFVVDRLFSLSESDSFFRLFGCKEAIVRESCFTTLAPHPPWCPIRGGTDLGKPPVVPQRYRGAILSSKTTKG